ncbi:acyl-CoA N-acyltransferase [Xylaria arbuscula]|nr:acyl-CoA N-acyltransferase [Xylaria arbuscula]
MFAMTRSDLEKNLKRKNSLCVKAVDNRGIIVGHATWVFSDGVQKPASTRDIGDGESGLTGGENSASKTNRLQARGDEATNGDHIERLQALEEADMQDWLKNLVSADTPCMLVVGLAVSSDHQGQGIGSALLRHGNAIADERRLSIWVHSSHQAYNAYRKAGFETRRELMIDLDDYAPRPPRDGEATMMRITGQPDDSRWGQYVIRYMKRQPGSN